MTAVAALRNVDDHGDKYQALLVWCPGCEKTEPEVEPFGGLHMLPVTGDKEKRPTWDWNGDLELVTLQPSILTKYGETEVCHSFLTNGIWNFLPDSTHKLAGQKVPMVELPWWVTE